MNSSDTTQQVRLSWYNVLSQRVSKFQYKLRPESLYVEYKLKKAESLSRSQQGFDNKIFHNYVDIKMKYKYVTMKGVSFLDEQFQETLAADIENDGSCSEDSTDEDSFGIGYEDDETYYEMYTPIPKQDKPANRRGGCYQVHRFRVKQRTRKQKDIENLNIYERVHLKKTREVTTMSEAKSFSNRIYTEDDDRTVTDIKYDIPKNLITHQTESDKDDIEYFSYAEEKTIKGQQSVRIRASKEDVEAHRKLTSDKYNLDALIAHQRSQGWQPTRGFAAADWMSKLPEDYSINELFLFLLRHGNTKLAELMKYSQIDGSLMKVLLREESLLCDLLDCVSMNEIKKLRESFFPTRPRCNAMNSVTAATIDYVII